MDSALGNVLLVLLSDRPATAHDLHRRHTDTFSDQYPVDISRVAITLSRLERLGHVRSSRTPSPDKRKVCDLTETGRRQQRAWMLEIPPESGPPEVVLRVLLAVAAADRPTLDAVLDSCIAVMGRRHDRRRD